MTERKPGNMSWQGFVEQQIQEAQQEGQFENLTGTGKPIPDIDNPLDEDWWLKQKIKREQVSLLPPLLQARQEIEQTRQLILSFKNEEVVRGMLEKLNQKVLEAIRSPQPSPNIVVLPVNIDREIARWREARQSD